MTHEHVYHLDSNLSLSYHHSLYTRSGTLNNQGMKIIFSDLFDLMLAIKQENARSVKEKLSGEEVPESESLFRP